MSFFSSVPVILFVISVVVAITQLHHSQEKTITKRHVVETFLKNLIFFMYGIGGLIAFFFLVFSPDAAAQYAGWATGSPFEYEVGIVNLAFGVIGILTLYTKEVFWLASVVLTTILMWGWGIGLAYVLATQETVNPPHISMFMWMDFVFPLIILVLFIKHLQMKRLPLK